MREPGPCSNPIERLPAKAIAEQPEGEALALVLRGQRSHTKQADKADAQSRSADEARELAPLHVDASQFGIVAVQTKPLEGQDNAKNEGGR